MFKIIIPLAFLLVVVAATDNFGMKYAMRIYEDCQKSEGFGPCLKKKAIVFFDRARNLESKDEALSTMLWDRIAAFANSRTIQLSLPKMTGSELNKGVEEGRGKMKKMMGMMMMGAAMKMAAMIPLAIAGLFVLAGKALIVSKIALLLAGIIALKKLIAQKSGGGGGGHESHGWSSGGGGGSGGGWDRRSHNDVSDLAYSAYKKD